MEQSGVSFRTLQRWVALYRRHGLTSLARQSRLDRGIRRTVPAALQMVIEGLGLEKPPIITALRTTEYVDNSDNDS